MTISSPKRDFE